MSGTARPEPAPDPVDACGTVTVAVADLADKFAGTDPARLAAVLDVATLRALDYAPAAPTAMLNEAVWRFVGYLLGSDTGPVKSETIGPRSVEWTTNHAAMWRNCGAAGLLTRYRRRRAGAI